MDKGDSEPKNKKKQIGLIVMLCGIATLVAGLVFLLISIFTGPGLRDAEYLVKMGTWVREDKPGVIWQFTEIGKGTLTTDALTNSYDFIWAIKDGVLEIETSWLYTLNDSYEYELNQNTKTLTLTSDDKTITFLANEQTQ